jgi:UDP-N-acetylmuramate dehydrogenase
MPGIIAGATLKLTPADPSVIHARICETIETRCARQPVSLPSAGSVFKRPPGDYAGRLVEGSGCKGLRVGGAEVSEKHANFIVNADAATAADVLGLIREVQRRVQDQFGVDLETEVRVIGEPVAPSASLALS